MTIYGAWDCQRARYDSDIGPPFKCEFSAAETRKIISWERRGLFNTVVPFVINAVGSLVYYSAK